MPAPYRLIAPGPVPVPKVVNEAMNKPLLHHRTPQFEKILQETWRELRSVFATKEPVLILSGSGSAGMEAAVTNLVSPGDVTINVVSGKFGERWADMCANFGAKVHRLDVPWGESVSLKKLEHMLEQTPGVRAVFSQACETSTATLHPIEKMSRLIRQKQPDALFAVDAITAVGCLPLPMDEWDLDVVVGGSQKAFMIPPGLAFIALSPRAWAAQKNARAPKFYFDLAAERRANEKGENHFTISTPLVVGLHAVLTRLREAGRDAVERRCAVLAEATRHTGEELGLRTFSRSPSTSVTALEVADSAKVRDWLEREHNITVMGGQDQLKGKILRVGHMGDVRDEDMLALFDALAAHAGKSYDRESLTSRLAEAPALFGA